METKTAPQHSTASAVVSLYDPAFTPPTGQTGVCDSVSYDSGFVWCSRSVWRFGGLGGKRGHQSAAALLPPSSPLLPPGLQRAWHRNTGSCGSVCPQQEWDTAVSYLTEWGRWRGDMKMSFSSVLSVVGDKDGGLSLQPVLQLRLMFGQRWTAERRELIQPPLSLDSAPNWTTITQMQTQTGFISWLSVDVRYQTSPVVQHGSTRLASSHTFQQTKTNCSTSPIND